MRIKCPYCGERALEEFTYRGDATVTRPASLDASAADAWADYVYFRDNPAGYQEIHFPPLSAWMVFTDGISHSVLTGQHALVTTVLVPLENCRLPDLAPYRVLARSAA